MHLVQNICFLQFWAEGSYNLKLKSVIPFAASPALFMMYGSVQLVFVTLHFDGIDFI